MLDSIGDRTCVSLNCANCGRPVRFIKYTPKFDHGGHTLDIGSCITKDSEEIQKAGLYLIGVKKGKLISSEFHLKGSNETYHYNGFQIPKFGFYPGEIMCVCFLCKGLPMVDMVKEKISHEVEEIIFDIMCFEDTEIVFKKKSHRKKKYLAQVNLLFDLFKKLHKMSPKIGKEITLKLKKGLEKLYSPQ